MLHQVNTGAANYAQTHTAFHRRDGGANALTGIRAAHSAFIKRHAPPNAEPDAGRNPAAGLAAANRLANAANTEASAFLKGAKETQKGGLYVAIDILESSEEGRELLAKIKASDAGIEFRHSQDTGRTYVYMSGYEKELEKIRQSDWERTYGETAQTAQTAAPAAQHADSVEISDAGRELAAKMSADNAAVASIQLRVNDPNNPSIEFLDRSFMDREAVTQRKLGLAPPLFGNYSTSDANDDFNLYGDITIKFMIRSNSDVGEEAANKLTGELGRLLLDPNGTLEERTVNREKGLALAKYIADNYIGDPVNKQMFLDRVKELANTSEMRDKGYEFRYNMEDGTTTIEKTDDNLLASWGKPTEKAATTIIEQIKNSLDMNAVKEDALNTFKKIMANYLTEDGTLAAPTPKTVSHLAEISDAGRELAAKMSEANAAPASILKFVKANGEEYTAQLRKHDPDNPFFVLDEDIFTKAPTPINDSFDPKDPFILYGDITIKFMIRSNSGMGEEAANKLTGELGRLLLDPNGTLEERTVNREKGLALAKYIADNYIDDPVNKQTFLDRAKELAYTSEMRDKGYDFYHHDDGTVTVVKTDDNLLASWGKPTEKAATAIIEQVKNSLDKNAVKEDAINTFKKIMAEYLNADGTLAAPAAPKVVGHLVM